MKMRCAGDCTGIVEPELSNEGGRSVEGKT